MVVMGFDIKFIKRGISFEVGRVWESRVWWLRDYVILSIIGVISKYLVFKEYEMW